MLPRCRSAKFFRWLKAGASLRVLTATSTPAMSSASFRVPLTTVRQPVAQMARSAVELLDDAGRERELARMLGGVEVGSEAHAAARSLLEQAVAADAGVQAPAAARRARRSGTG